MRSKKLIVAAIALIVIGTLAGFAYRIYLNPVRDTAIDLVPPDAVFYGSVFLSPSTHQKQALGDLLRYFPVTRTPDLAKGELEAFLDRFFASRGFVFSRDVEPWIGRQMALFIAKTDGGPDEAVLFSVKDPLAAMKALTESIDAQPGPVSRRSYKGADYVSAGPLNVGIVGNFVVFAREELFTEVVRAFTGQSLGDEPDFRITTSDLPADRVATIYVHTSRIVDAFYFGGDAGIIFPGVLSGIPSIGGTVFLRSNAVVFDVRISGASSLAAKVTEVRSPIASSLAAMFRGLLPDSVRPLVNRLLTDGDTGSAPSAQITDEVRAGLGPDYSVRGILRPEDFSPFFSPELTRDLAPLSYIALGTRVDHDTLFARLVIGVR